MQPAVDIHQGRIGALGVSGCAMNETSDGIIVALQNRINILQREYETMSRTAQMEIARQENEIARLRMALRALEPPGIITGDDSTAL
jgi:hypothetical protein